MKEDREGKAVVRLAETSPGYPQGQPAGSKAPAGGAWLTQQVPVPLVSPLMPALAGPEF